MPPAPSFWIRLRGAHLPALEPRLFAAQLAGLYLAVYEQPVSSSVRCFAHEPPLVTLTNVPVNVGTNNQIVLPVSTGMQFFRPRCRKLGSRVPSRLRRDFVRLTRKDRDYVSFGFTIKAATNHSNGA